MFVGVREVTLMLLGLPPSASAAKYRDALNADRTTKDNHGKIKIMAERLDMPNVLDLFRRRKGDGPVAEGDLDVWRWIESGVLPDGKPDPAYDLSSIATKRNYITTLVKLTNPDKVPLVAARVDPAVRHFLQRKHSEYINAVDKRSKKNRMSAREQKTLLPWDKITELYRTNRDRLTPPDRLIVDFWMIDPLQNPPMRVDLGDVRIVETAAAVKRLRDDQDYLLIKRKTPSAHLHIRQYKTQKAYGEHVRKLPKRLVDAILKNLDAGGKPWRKWLFQSRNGAPRPLLDNTFSQQIGTAFQRLTGVPIGASNLRKSFISWLKTSEMSVEELEDIALKMMHSLDQQAKYKRIDIKRTLDMLGGDGGEDAHDAARDPTPDDRPVCWRCRRPGHYSRDCPDS